MITLFVDVARYCHLPLFTSRLFATSRYRHVSPLRHVTPRRLFDATPIACRYRLIQERKTMIIERSVMMARGALVRQRVAFDDPSMRAYACAISSAECVRARQRRGEMSDVTLILRCDTIEHMSAIIVD